MSDKDIVKVAHELLGQHSRIHALNDSDPDKDVDVAWMISALADEVEMLRKERNIAVRFLSKHGYERCAGHCDSWHQKGENHVSM